LIKSSNSVHWIVVGGGYRGIMSSILLRRLGAEVTLIEKSGHLGGILHSNEWEGLYIDKGAHLFDNVDDRVTELTHEILGEDFIPVEVNYAVVMENGKIDGLSVPDFSNCSEDVKHKALFELIEAQSIEQKNDPQNLHELYQQRFGNTIADLLNGPTKKMLRLSARELAPEAFGLTPFGRIRFLPDSMSEFLKKNKSLDDKIVRPVGNDGLRHYHETVDQYSHRNFYPTPNGMNSFCKKAHEFLAKIGIDVRLNCDINYNNSNNDTITFVLNKSEKLVADKCLWSSGLATLSNNLFGQNLLQGTVLPVPMVLYYFLLPKTQIGEYAYIHDFTENHLLFRPSAIGRYGGQITSDNFSYVCLEAVVDKDSKEWTNSEGFIDQIWSEALELDFVSGARPDTFKIEKIPASYVPAKSGFSDQKSKFLNKIEKKTNGLLLSSDHHAFSKVSIQEAIENLIS
jgi:hypothetical protein